MSTERSGRAARHRRRRGWPRALLAALAGAAIAVGVLEARAPRLEPARGQAGGHGDARASRLPPDVSGELDPATAPSAPAPAGRSVAALREAGGKGLIIIRREKASQGIDAAFVKDLDRRLRRQIADYRPVRAQILHLKSGEALFFSYIRRTKGLLATITVIPAGDHSFAIDTVSPPATRRSPPTSAKSSAPSPRPRRGSAASPSEQSEAVALRGNGP